MPKLPVITAKTLIRALKKLGFFELRHKSSSHLMIGHADGRCTIVSIHPGKDIPNGTLRAILRDIKISPEELIDNL